jgi:5-methylcytosine-specific restriction protein A
MDLAALKPGLMTTRAAMKELFGGGTQGGIIPSNTTPNILIYVDHDSGKKYGYEDGWLEEEDEFGPVFEYTGQGTRGEQTFLGLNGSRNAAVLCHADTGRSLRVFMAATVYGCCESNSNSPMYRWRLAADFEPGTLPARGE